MDAEKYLLGGYSPDILEQIVAWRNISNLIGTHTQDAISIAQDNKKGK